MNPNAERIRRAVLDARELDDEARAPFLRRELGDPDLVEGAERLLESHPERIDDDAIELMIAAVVRSFTSSRGEARSGDS